ncbi:MAG: hypothetical protein V2I25_08015 [Woeseiaceae bacterium]|jgi:hypothetical protein|nr:hypothetical protein [Woeseiaceae bacterium]
MVDTLEPKPGFAFWVIGAVALVWNLFGLMLYVMQVSATPEQLAAAYTPEQVELLLAVPAWATSMTAIATTAGVLGCLLLLLRKRLAVPFFAVSLVALVLQDLYTFVLADTLAVFGSQPLIIQVVVFVVALLLLWYSRRAAADRLLT